MPSFTYKAVNTTGQSVQGVLTAENYQVALRQLEEKALYPVKVTEGIEQRGIALGGRRVKTQHLTIFYGQLADLLRAGVPMLRSLDVIAKQRGQGGLPLVVKELREDVAGGMSLGDAMTKHPRVFSPLHSSMVKAGEQGGFLEDVLHRIAVFSEKQDELRNKLIGSMIYPCILVTVGLGVVALLMLFVVPKLGEHLREENYNVLTHIVFGITAFLKTQYMTVVFGAFALIGGYTIWKRTAAGKEAMEKFKLKAPVFGPIYTMMSICRFCRILGTLLHNGVPILQSLRIARDSAGNEVLARVIDGAAENVRKGETLSKPLGESGLFPPAVIDMIAVAEEGNNLESVLVQIADTNETRTARAIELGVRILEPVLLALMAGMVFCIAIALLLPILTMGSSVQ